MPCPRCSSPIGCTFLPNGTILCASPNQFPGWTCVRAGGTLSLYRRGEAQAAPVTNLKVATAQVASERASASAPVDMFNIPTATERQQKPHEEAPVIAAGLTVGEDSTVPGTGQTIFLTSRKWSPVEHDARQTESGGHPADHFVDINKSIPVPKGGGEQDAREADQSSAPTSALNAAVAHTVPAVGNHSLQGYSCPTQATPSHSRPVRLLIDWITRRGGTVSARDLQRANPQNYPKTHIAALALDCLAMVGLGEWSERVNVHGPKVRLFTLRESLANEATVVTNAVRTPSVRQPLVAG